MNNNLKPNKNSLKREKVVLYIIITIRINIQFNLIRSFYFSLQIASFIAGVDTLYSVHSLRQRIISVI